FLVQNARPGDQAWTGSVWELNQLLFYLRQEGANVLIVRCREQPLIGDGHMTHVASLCAEDVVWEAVPKSDLPERLWLVGRGAALSAPSQKMKLVTEKAFTDEQGTAEVALWRLK